MKQIFRMIVKVIVAAGATRNLVRPCAFVTAVVVGTAMSLISPRAEAATRPSPILVADVYPGSGGSYPNTVAALNGTVFFSAHTASGFELWKTNGTKAGTVQLKDINPGVGDSYPMLLTAVGNQLFFTAFDGDQYQGGNGRALWKTDGTAAGTVLVSNLGGNTLSDQLSIYSLTAVGNTLYFVFGSFRTGWSLYKSDGTDDGTVRIKDFGEVSYGPYELTAFNGALYFGAEDTDHGVELWRSDGTEAGTTLAADIVPGDLSGLPRSLAVAGGSLYFAASDDGLGDESSLWKTDGASTVLVKNPGPGSEFSFVDSIGAAGPLVYFRARADAGPANLWKSDGTEAGTVVVDETTNLAAPTEMTALGSIVFFTSWDENAFEYVLWRSDGTDAGTFQLTAFAAAEVTAAGRLVFFRADNGVVGEELWMSDGTFAGTTLVKDIARGSASSEPEWLTASGRDIYFAATDSKGTELWRARAPR